jgi:hypothetical protein
MEFDFSTSSWWLSHCLIVEENDYQLTHIRNGWSDIIFKTAKNFSISRTSRYGNFPRGGKDSQ